MNFKEYAQITGENIRLYREQKGLSQQKVGDKIKVSRQHLSRIELGEANPTLEILYLLSEVLEVPISAFLGDYSSKIEMLLKKYRFIQENDMHRLLIAMDRLNNNEIEMVINVITAIKK
jgi:transcriptional regulator with XRE-family HTH domain